MLSNLFICASYEKNEFEKHIPAPLFRRRFTLSRRQSAEVTVCGLGFYELYINGEKNNQGASCPPTYPIPTTWYTMTNTT